MCLHDRCRVRRGLSQAALGSVVVAWVVTCVLADTALYSTSWEQGPAAWRGNVKSTACPCPDASISFTSQAAARTGAVGVQVAINASATAGWHVQLASPIFNFTPSFLYTACFWVRAAAPLEWRKDVLPMYLDYPRPDGQVVVALGLNFRVTPQWRQLCLEDFQPPANTTPSGMKAYYALDMGLMRGTIHIDDFTLTSRPDTAAADAEYASAAAVAARIEAHRKGDFSLQFVDRTSGLPLGGGAVSDLRLRLEQHGFPFGSAIEWDGVPSARQAWYLGAVKRHFNALVPEISFKWPVYEPGIGNYSERYQHLLRNHINFSAANDFVLTRGVTLEWLTANGNMPKHWSRQNGCENYRTYLRNRITRDVSLFRGKFQSYDVFNEILHEQQFVENCPDMFPAILYDGHRWAAEADPSAQLCLNEPGIIDARDGDKWWRGLVQLVRDMRDAGAPLHCIGLQAYLATSNLASPAYMKPRLDKLASLNLSLHISEFNFYSFWDSAGYKGPVWNGTEAEHAALYDKYVRFWFSVLYIKSMIMWNFWDSTNWIKNGGIYYPNTTAKASAAKLLELWGSEWNTTIVATNVQLPGTGMYGPYRGFYGKYLWEAVVGGQRYTGYVRFPASGGALQSATVVVG